MFRSRLSMCLYVARAHGESNQEVIEIVFCHVCMFWNLSQ